MWLRKTKRNTNSFQETILMTFILIFIAVKYVPWEEFLQHKILRKVHWQSQITVLLLENEQQKKLILETRSLRTLMSTLYGHNCCFFF